MQCKEFGETAHVVVRLDVLDDDHMLIQHLEEVEIGALRLGTADEGSAYEALQLGEVSRLHVYSEGLREGLLAHTFATRVHDFHEVVAQVHNLVNGLVVLDSILWCVDSQLLPQVDEN